MQLRFDNVSVDPTTHLITGPGGHSRVEHRVMCLLQELAARPRQAVSRQDLMQALWPDVVVSDDSLTKAVSELRKALRTAGHNGKGITTIPKHGYALEANVRVDRAVPAPVRAERPARRPRMAMLAVGAVFVALLFSGRMPSVEIHRLPGSVPDGALLPVTEYVTASGERIKLKGVVCDDRTGRTLESVRQAVEANRLPDGCRLSY